ncbi:MAG: hypothetical protein Ct9H90mP9_3680 [Pseudomonadota bacterium]|nr:MAG: hypothetical protein Ct9H90mP9_3680 [Pseudomonadota bacterium]
MEEDRADVILPALVIFEKNFSNSQAVQGFVIPAVGLRDGILDEMGNGKGEKTGLEHPGTGHFPSARYFCREKKNLGPHAARGKTLRELSLQLFDELF